MFNKKQIEAALAKVSSAADFPALIRDLKDLGVVRYVHAVASGVKRFDGDGGFTLELQIDGDAWPVAAEASAQKLTQAIQAHDHGKIDYAALSKQVAEAGVARWIADLARMQVMYLDGRGNVMLRESIPEHD